MLNRLFIKNYALIENLDILFDAGLNIITGETGAGKSIMMGALGLILGNRAEGKHFFREDQKCVIEGFFKIDAYGLQDFFQENELDYDDETIIRREIAVDGKSRAFVNDSPVTLNILKLLGEQLIDIHSQHATLQLNTERFQLMILDNVAKNQAILQDYKQNLSQYKHRQESLSLLREDIASANAALDFNQFQFDELDQAHLEDGEQERLEAELSQLENAEEIKRGLLGASHLLSESEQSATFSLKESLQQLQSVERFMPSMEELVKRLQSVWIEVKDIADEVGAKEQEVFMDEGRLVEVNERLSVLYSLQKKHRVDTVSELITLRDELEQKVLVVANQGEQLAALEQDVAKCLEALEKTGKYLHDARQQAVTHVEKYVQEVLAEIGMPNAQLKIELSLLEIDKYKTTGADDVRFLFSANKGQPLQPIHRVASGGELSRVMLAVKSLVAQTSALPTIIFDEIDTGISGEVALKVGEIMERLAGDMQVLAITHLPQIASKGQAHFKVFKEDEGEKTKTDITLLAREDRILEVAQMLSGANPGASALQHAKELIER
ncbi:DNA repair protein RecN [Sphingobacterium chuzhouense]|uniref:DNA repair protein RecN n=1 Tax=Sphingobacterium chuzhouense TaxID=1742264 RepID=A0ABR7XSL4_9SPHI|nr:DNA repair protein RecN [Sphingobacterium chuzhouense]MBD1422160.1 DNA repair protein RecN [Sphingobacterium chuzhouense]